MKKIIAFILVLIIALFTACSAVQDNKSEEASTQQNSEAEVSDASDDTDESSSASKPGQDESSELPAGSVLNRVAVVVAFEGYQTSELRPVYDTLISQGFDVIMVSEQTGTAEGSTDTIDIDMSFEQLSGSDTGGIVIIGGPGSLVLWDNVELRRLIKEVDELGRVTAAICMSPLTLAYAEVLESGEYACWYNCEELDENMSALGIIDSGLTVTVSGNVITGNGPSASQEFAEKVAEALQAQRE